MSLLCRNDITNKNWIGKGNGNWKYRRQHDPKKKESSKNIKRISAAYAEKGIVKNKTIKDQ